ncbi:MAG: YigZ family protein [Gemmatimonadaceae bacterium]|nr:YigZ family protein [Gemmatimonadaceae bacterium]
MTAADRYPIPAARARAELVIERSRFVCTVSRAESPEAAHAFIREMQREFEDATHNCWAFVAGPPGSSARIGMSDDGEPHGTAGRPMLTVLMHSGVGEIVAVVTRHYGGTKLGTGGLVRAYSAAVQEALARLERRERVETVDVKLRVGYAAFAAVRNLLPGHEGELLDERFGDNVELLVRVPASNVDALRVAVGNATSGQGTFGLE